MIIAAFNPKGGTGKTTTAVSVAAVLAGRGSNVLLVDLEADLNASISLGMRPSESVPSIAEVLLHEARPSLAIRPSSFPNLSLIPGSPRLAAMDALLRNIKQPERRLADVLRPVARQFDHVVLDSPAGYSVIAQSIPVAADHLVLPIRADYLSLESLAQFLRWYRDRQAARRVSAKVAGMLLTMVSYRRLATREIVKIIRAHNRTGVFRTEIPEDPRVAEAPSHGIPLCTYAPRTRACAAYEQVTTELLARVR
jgi:chromosome partitioning protein